MLFPEPGVSEEGAKNKDPGINTTDIKEDGLGAFQVGWQQYFFCRSDTVDRPLNLATGESSWQNTPSAPSKCD